MSDRRFDLGLGDDRSTIVDFLRWRAIHEPDKIAYTFLVDRANAAASLTYAELDRRARMIAARLQSQGMPGERALLLYPPGLEYIAAFFGCLYAGALAVPSYPPRLSRADPRLQAIIADSRAALALTTSAILGDLEQRFAHTPELARLRWLATDQIAEPAADSWRRPNIDAESVAFLQYTSGSTSAPKGVIVGHGNLLHNLEVIRRGFGHGPESRGVIWLPPYHDMGLIGGILQPLYVGFPVVLMAPVAFLQSPLRWLEAVSRYRATTSGGPNFAYDLCTQKIAPEQRAALDLRDWEVAFCGAEPIRPATLERFAAIFAPCGFRSEAFYPCYGLAEATLMVSGGSKGALPIIRAFEERALAGHRAAEPSAPGEKARRLVGCGGALLDQTIVIADPQTCALCPPGQVGEIWVAGPSVAQGYWNRAQQTADTFRASVRDTHAGPFLRTGDLGFQHAGELFVTGRLKDLLIVRGRNFYPQDIEATAERSHPGLRPGCGAAFSVDSDGEERVVVVQEVQRQYRNADGEELARAIRQAVADAHELHLYAVALIKPGSIPKTSSGKIRRGACRELFLAHGLDLVCASIHEPADAADEPAPISLDLLLSADSEQRRALLERYLQHSVADVVRLPAGRVDPRQPLSALGLDSLMAVELQHRIERDLSVALPMVSFLEGASPAQLADRLLDAIARPAPEVPEPPARPQAAETPLAHGQQALWFLHQLAPEKAVYTIPAAVRMDGRLQPAALAAALRAIVARHATLRTTFAMIDGRPVAVVAPRQALPLPILDLRGLPAHERMAEAERLARREIRRPFDLSSGPLLRATLIRLAPTEHIIVLVMHHIISDGWSTNVLVRELSALYAAYAAGERSREPAAPPIQYADFARWQREWLRSDASQTQLDYWMRRLEGVPALLELPTDRPRPAVLSFQGDSRAFRLAPDLVRALRTLAQGEAATLFMALLAGFQTLLARYSGADDIAIGSPIANRNRADLKGLIGLFVNTLVLRGDLSGRPSFRELAKRTRATCLDAYAHPDLPFELIVDALAPQRDLARAPLFQVMFVLHDDPLRSQALPGLALHPVELHSGTAKFDLTLTMREDGADLSGSMEFSRDLFDATTIARMLGHFQVLLAALAAEPDRPVAHAPLLSAPERQQLLIDWNDTQAGVRGQESGIRGTPTDACIDGLFAAQAARTPDAIAVAFDATNDVRCPEGAQTNDERSPTIDDRRWTIEAAPPSSIVHRPSSVVQLTYAELDARANRLAHHLRRLGVGPETRVGLRMRREPELLIAILGVHKAGGAYLPIDPTLPAERVAFMIEDAQVRVIVTNDERRTTSDAQRAPRRTTNDERHNADWRLPTDKTGRLVTLSPCHLVDLEADWPTIAQESAENPASGAAPDNLAYVIYTSGSTGAPKGVMVTRRGLANYLAWAHEALPLDQGRGAPVHSSIAFDLTITGLFAPLVSGRRALLLPETPGAEALAQALERERDFSLIKLTPAHLQLLSERLAPRHVHGCARALVVGGENLPAEQIAFWRSAAPGTRIVNEYGPTETVVGCCVYWAPRGERATGALPIGRPIRNIRLYVLDRELQPAPIGVPGELYIGGAQLARGYLGRPDLTAACFIPNPFVTIKDERRTTNDKFADPSFVLRPSSFVRLYKTGDRARRRPDGMIECLGRIDFQLKIRGFRIEPGEIEAALADHPAVREAAVWAWEMGSSKRLVAYVVPTPDERRTTNDEGSDPSIVHRLSSSDEGSDSSFVLRPSSLADELRRWLKERLPDYVLPAAFVVLEALPRTPNGKLNRKALPRPAALRPDTASAYAAPQTEAERAIAAIWREVLQIERVGRYDNFFELGGDSITSIQIVSRMSQQGLKIRPQHIFQHQTIAELAQAAVAVDSKPEDAPVSGQVELTPIQHWFFEQALPNVHCFSQAITLRAADALDARALQVALQKLLDHHDALRMRYTRQRDGWRQYNRGVGAAIVPMIVDLSTIGGAAAQNTLDAAKNRIRTEIDIVHGPLFKAALFRIEADQALLFLTCHHLVVDGISWRTIVDDLVQGYQQALQGRSIRLAPKTLSFLEWSKRLSAYAQSDEATKDLDYWRSTPEVHFSTLERAEVLEEHISDASGVATIDLSPDATTAQLRAANRAYRTTTNDLLVVALVRALQALSDQETVAITMEGHGRDALGEADALARTVGWCTTLFPLALSMSGYTEIGPQIAYIKERIRDIPAKGLSFGALKYLSTAVEIRESLHERELPAILFNYLGQIGGVAGDLFHVHEFAGQPLPGFAKTRHVIEIIGMVFGEQLRVHLHYHRAVYDKAAIAALGQRFEEELAMIIAHCTAQARPSFTPSDFPLLRASQREIDRFQASFATNQPHERVIEDIYPLSPMQQGMLLYALAAPRSLVSFQQFRFTLQGSLHQQCFERAWEHMIGQHPSLRTIFDWQHFAQPVQIVLRAQPSPVEWHDLSDLPHAAQEQHLAEYSAHDRDRSFDLARGPLIRILIFRLKAREFRCLLSLHHIISDGWSFPLLFESLLQNYEALRQDRALPAAPARLYKEYIAWLHEQDKTEAEAFWRATLGDFKAPTPLPIGGGSASDHGEPAEHRSTLPAELAANLKDFANRHRVTLNTLVQAAWAILLRHYSQQDVVFGVAVSGRPASIPGIERTIGLFINNLPLRVRFDDDTTVVALLDDIQATAAAMRNYEYSSLPDIQACSSVPAARKLFDSLVVFQNYPMNEAILSLSTDFKLIDLSVKELAHYDLTISVYSLDSLQLSIQYNPDTVGEVTISRLVGDFEGLLAYFIAHPHARLSELRAALDLAPPPPNTPERSPEQPSAPQPLYRAQTEMERTIAAVWQQVLGIDEIDIRENILQIGANSLSIATVHARLQAATRREFPIIDMFTYPTVKALAEHLGQPGAQPATLDQASERAKTQKAAIDRQRALTRARMKK